MKIFASLLNANFLELGKDIKNMEESGIDGFHLDVMDGHFVPNISLGIPIAEALRKATKKPIDIHLMVRNSEKFVNYFKDYGEYITVHIEISPEKSIKKIKEYGKIPGLAINPKTEIKTIFPYLKDVELVLIMSVHPGFGGQSFIKDVLKKAEKVKKEKENITLAIDGGINKEIIKEIRNYGFDIAVVGSHITKSNNRKKIIKELKYVSTHNR